MNQYRIQSFDHLPAQVAFRAYVVADASARSRSWAHTIGTWSLTKEVVPAELFREVVPEGHFLEACRSARDNKATYLSDREELAKPMKAELWQGCFGVPGARDATGAPCASCRQYAGCEDMASIVTLQLVESVGTSDPWLEKRRAGSRVRTAKSRAKKKLERAGSTIPGAARA